MARDGLGHQVLAQHVVSFVLVSLCVQCAQILGMYPVSSKIIAREFGLQLRGAC